MFGKFQPRLHQQLAEIRESGLYKPERLLAGRQGSRVTLQNGRRGAEPWAHNYPGLSGDARLEEAARTALERWGYGLSSVRFICGTQTLHKDLEAAVSRF